MDADKRLETLCKEFSCLLESEKDYILEISEALTKSVSEKIVAATHKNNLFPPDFNT